MKISVPATLIGVLAGAIFSLKVGKELTEDPEYLERLKNGLIEDSHVSISDVKNKAKARLSVIIFILTTLLIVLFGSIPALRPTFDGTPHGMPSLIEILMLWSTQISFEVS